VSMQEKECTLKIQVPVALRNAFMQAAEAEERPAQQIILDLLQEYVERAGKYKNKEAERAARQKWFEEAKASSELEGELMSEFEKKLGLLYIDGKISIDEYIEILKAH